METFKQVLLLGDIHGNINSVRDPIEVFDIKDSLIIQVGDFGTISQNKFGLNVSVFIKKMDKLNKLLKETNNTLYAIRGNHDDPVVFNGIWGVKRWGNITFLPDYTRKTINGKDYLFIGGGVSVDRLRSISHDTQYHYDEAVDFYGRKIEKCDVLVTHTCDAISLGIDWSNIDWWLNGQNDGEGDKNLKKELIEEGQTMLKIRDLCKPDFWFLGHFHETIDTTIKETRVRVLAKNEMYQFLPR